MNSIEGGEAAIVQLKRENARLQELCGRRSREIERKMGELRSALHQTDRDLPLAHAKFNKLEQEVKELRSVLSDACLPIEEPLEEATVQGTIAGRGRDSLSATETSERPSENSEGEPPREMHPVPPRASEEDVTPTDRCGMSPLHLAAMDGDVQGLRELIATGADTRLRDGWGQTPLHSALWKGGEEAVDLLAEVDCENDVEDGHGWTPLYWAAVKGHVGAVRKLLAGGARTRVQDRWGRTPLHEALSSRNEATAEVIVEADGSNDIRDHRGRTPLHLAVAAGFVGIVAKLLHNNPNPHLSDDDGKYPIQLALRGGRRDSLPRMILSSYALSTIYVDWVELELSAPDRQFCLEEVSACQDEIRLMKQTWVGASSLTCHEVVTRHVSRVAPRLLNLLSHCCVERDFPRFAHQFSLGLRAAEERRVSEDLCLWCFSLLPPLPVTCMDIVLRCLRGTDMVNFIRAAQFPSRE